MSMDATSNKQHTRSEEETNVSAARMQRTLRTIRALKCLGYQNSACVRECQCDELPCPLLTWLVTELWAACPELQGRRGDVVLMGELRDLLDKLFCPVTLLSADIPGPVLFNQVSEFLVSELQAAHILRYKALNPEDQTVKEGEAQKDQRVQDPYDDRPEDEYGDDEDTSSTRKEQTQAEVTLLIEDLHLDTASQFTDIIHEVESKLSLLPCGDMAEPLLQSNLNSTQWRQIKKLNAALLEDYQCRRQMMIKRFEVTLQSFAWGEGNQKERSDALASVPPIASLCLSSRVSLPLLLAAREDQSCILPVKAGPSTAVHKVLMGSVPDRGGRPGEIEPPMPVWEGRRKGTAKSARGGGGRNQQQQRKKEKTRKGRRESKSPE